MRNDDPQPTPDRDEQLAALEQQLATYRATIRFLRKWHHEFRTPMSSIIGFPILLLQEAQTAEEREPHQAILESGEQLLKLINEFFAFLKIEAEMIAYQPQPCHTEELVGHVIATHEAKAMRKGLTVIYEPTPDLPPTFYSDPALVEQILGRLMDNAIRYSETGRITVSVVADEARTATITVRDEGCGIDPDYLNKLQRYFKEGGETILSIYKGGAMSLALSKRLCDLLGGHLWVESQQGEGSTFYFSLPIR